MLTTQKVLDMEAHCHAEVIRYPENKLLSPFQVTNTNIKQATLAPSNGCMWGTWITKLWRLDIRHVHDTLHFALLVSWESHGMGQPQFSMGRDRKKHSMEKSGNNKNARLQVGTRPP